MSRNGINNNGNDCFMNSALQCLASCPSIINFINHYQHQDIKLIEIITKFNLGKFKAHNINGECKRILDTNFDNLTSDEINILTKLKENSKSVFIYISFKNIIKNLNDKKKQTINNSAFVSINKELSEGTIFSKLFSGRQNDPHEFLAYLLDQLHESKKTSIQISLPDNISEKHIYEQIYHTNFKKTYENNYSLFVKNLYYYILNCVECSKCKHVTYNVTPNDIMCVSIPNAFKNEITLYDCLDEMFKVESIDYKCEKCENTESNRMENKILSKPKQTLIINIKKYISSPTNNGLFKVNNFIKYPEILDINKYYCGSEINNYKLYGIINHTGGLDFGHYYSYIKQLKPDGSFDDKWICCNDSRVNNITDHEAMNSNNAYILFYTSNI